MDVYCAQNEDCLQNRVSFMLNVYLANSICSKIAKITFRYVSKDIRVFVQLELMKIS